MDQKEKQDKRDRDKIDSRIMADSKDDKAGGKDGGIFDKLQAQVQMSKGGAKPPGDEKQKLQDYDEAMRRIKDATGVSDVNEIIQKFATQSDTYNNLNELKASNERKLLELNDKRVTMRSEVERMQYEGLESMTRKQIDEVDKNVNSAQVKYERNKEKLERINKIMVNANAGIKHLAEKLDDIKLESIPNVIVQDNTLVEALLQAEQKLEYLFGLVKGDTLYEEAICKIKGVKKEEVVPEGEAEAKMQSTTWMQSTQGANQAAEPTMNNIRVKLPDKDDDDLSEVDVEAEVSFWFLIIWGSSRRRRTSG